MHEPNLLTKISLLAEAALAKQTQNAMQDALEIIVALSRYCSDVISPTDLRLTKLEVNHEWEDINRGNDNGNE